MVHTMAYMTTGKTKAATRPEKRAMNPVKAEMNSLIFLERSGGPLIQETLMMSAYFLYKLTKRDRIRTSRIKQRQLRKLERLNEKIRREEARLVREIPTQSGNDPEDIAKHAKEMEEYRLKQAGLRDQKEILKGLMNEFQEDFNQAQRKVDRALQLVSQMRQSKHRSIEKMIQSIA